MISIGTKFKGIGKVRKNDVYEVVEILNCYSQKSEKYVKSIYIAKGINTLATNEFEVCKTTILRGIIN
jgi:hypothetical protein